MKKRILYIQFRDDKSQEHDNKCIRETLGDLTEGIDTLNAVVDEEIKDIDYFLTKYSCAILGGSGQFYLTKETPKLRSVFSKHEELFRTLLEKDFPTLGICFGHQIIGMLLGANIVADTNKAESGSTLVYTTENTLNDPVFANIPDGFYAQMAHKDSVTSLPHGCILTLTNENCPIQGFKYKNNIYTVQFHPELNKKQVLERFKLYPEDTNGKTDEELMRNIPETSNSTKILLNFVNRYYEN